MEKLLLYLPLINFISLFSILIMADSSFLPKKLYFLSFYTRLNGWTEL